MKVWLVLKDRIYGPSSVEGVFKHRHKAMNYADRRIRMDGIMRIGSAEEFYRVEESTMEEE